MPPEVLPRWLELVAKRFPLGHPAHLLAQIYPELSEPVPILAGFVWGQRVVWLHVR
jgi:hypothetical protein